MRSHTCPRRPQRLVVQIRRQDDELIVRCPYDRLAIPALKAHGAVVDRVRKTWYVPAAAEAAVHQVLADQFWWDPETPDPPPVMLGFLDRNYAAPVGSAAAGAAFKDI